MHLLHALRINPTPPSELYGSPLKRLLSHGRLASYTQQLHSISVNHSLKTNPNPNPNPNPT